MRLPRVESFIGWNYEVGLLPLVRFVRLPVRNLYAADRLVEQAGAGAASRFRWAAAVS